MIKDPLSLPFLKKQIDKIIKKYPKEENYITNIINNIPVQEAYRFPGFHEYEIYKLKCPLKKYKFGKRNGLRIVFYKYGDDVYPFAFYMHQDYKGKSEFQMINENFKKLVNALK